MNQRWDETWHRLLEWTNGQAPSERLSAQILLFDGFQELDPSHPLGGQDSGKDALCKKDGAQWIMAAYFPRGQQDFANIKNKFKGDLAGVTRNRATAMAFVTNQELRLSEREELRSLAAPFGVELYHLERITTILDSPKMSKVRQQFVNIESSESSILLAKKMEAGDALWAAMVEFRERTPSVIVVLDFVTAEEEKTLNQYPKVDVQLRALSEDQFPNWSSILDPVEKYRHVLGEDLWLLAFITRAIFMRIIWVLMRERDRRPMLPWRDDHGIQQHLGRVCTPSEISYVCSRNVGAVHWLRNHLEAKILEGVRALQQGSS